MDDHRDTHKDLYDKIASLNAHIGKCEVERARMAKDIEDLEQHNEKQSAWKMRLTAISATIIMGLCGLIGGMYSHGQVRDAEIAHLDSKVVELQGQVNKLFNIITDNFNISAIYGPLGENNGS